MNLPAIQCPFLPFSPLCRLSFDSRLLAAGAECSWGVAVQTSLDICRWSCWSGFEHLLIKRKAGWGLLNSRSSAGFLLDNIAAFNKIKYLGDRVSHSSISWVPSVLKPFTGSQVGADFKHFSPQGRCIVILFNGCRTKGTESDFRNALVHLNPWLAATVTVGELRQCKRLWQCPEATARGRAVLASVPSPGGYSHAALQSKLTLQHRLGCCRC